MSGCHLGHLCTALFALPVDGGIFQEVDIMSFEELNVVSTLLPQLL